MAVRVSMVALPTCGKSVVRGARQQARVHGRLAVEDIEPGAVDRSRLQGIGQGVLVDDRAACRVDDDGGRLHEGQFGGADEMAGGLGQRHVESDDVGPG